MKHEIVILEDGTIDVDSDPLTEKLLKIKRQNTECIEFLNEVGFDGSQFFHYLPVLNLTKEGNWIAVTVPLIRAQQDELAKANTDGKRHAVAARIRWTVTACLLPAVLALASASCCARLRGTVTSIWFPSLVKSRAGRW